MFSVSLPEEVKQGIFSGGTFLSPLGAYLALYFALRCHFKMLIFTQTFKLRGFHLFLSRISGLLLAQGLFYAYHFRLLFYAPHLSVIDNFYSTFIILLTLYDLP